ncbi:MAG: hypothetical protein Greene041679_108 [Parcubacteria group bacterium Greene0416_79]|nr:MAG: hypothetical protein Greene041679_108 [Parcubacteria group bacterium Greene0416_79]
MTTIQISPARLHADSSLQAFQTFNRTVYEAVNNRDFGILEMACRLARYASRVALWVRKAEMERTGYHLSMMLSWLCALTNRMGLSMEQEVATYCVIELQSGAPIAELQKTFAARHTDVSLERACLCLAEKVLGVASELEYYQETHEVEHFRNMAKRMAQSVEALLVVAGKLDLSLGEELARYFEGGCNHCHRIPCGFGFRTDKVV